MRPTASRGGSKRGPLAPRALMRFRRQCGATHGAALRDSSCRCCLVFVACSRCHPWGHSPHHCPAHVSQCSLNRGATRRAPLRVLSLSFLLSMFARSDLTPLRRSDEVLARRTFRGGPLRRSAVAGDRARRCVRRRNVACRSEAHWLVAHRYASDVVAVPPPGPLSALCSCRCCRVVTVACSMLNIVR